MRENYKEKLNAYLKDLVDAEFELFERLDNSKKLENPNRFKKQVNEIYIKHFGTTVNIPFPDVK